MSSKQFPELVGRKLRLAQDRGQRASRQFPVERYDHRLPGFVAKLDVAPFLADSTETLPSPRHALPACRRRPAALGSRRNVNGGDDRRFDTLRKRLILEVQLQGLP